MKRWIAVSLVFVSAGIIRAENYEQCVERALRTNAYTDAVKCLRDAEQTEPKSYRIAYMFGDVFLKAGQPDSAIPHLRRAVDLKDDYAEAYDLLGNALSQKKNFPEAINAYHKAVDAERRSPTFSSVFGLGHAYAAADSFKQATLWLSKAIDIDHTQLGPYIELGDLYLMSKVYVLAKEQYELALALQPKSIPVRKHLAQAFEKNNEYDSAVSEYTIVLSLDSTDKGALAELAEIYVLAKQWGNAHVMFHREAELDPANLEVRMNEATTAYRAHEYADAIAPLNAVVAGTKSDSLKLVSMKLLAVSYSSTKKHAEAIGVYEKLLKLDSTSLSAEDYRQYAGALLETHDTAKAFVALEAFTLRDTTDCTICKLIGPKKMTQKDFAGAITFFKLRLKRCDTVVSVLKNVGLCYQVLEQPDTALMWYAMALAKKPYDGWATARVANIYFAKEERDTVLSIYKDFLAHTNADSAAPTEMADAYKYIGLIYLLKKDFAAAVDNLKKAQSYSKEDCDITLWLAQSYHNSQQKEEAIKLYKEVIRRHCKNEKGAQDGLKILDAK